MLGLSVVTNLLGGSGPTKQEQKETEMKQKEEKENRADNERNLEERKREFQSETAQNSPVETQEKKPPV